METIKIKYLRDVEPIKQAHDGEWFDLRCAEDTELKAGEFKLIPLGVAMKLPKLSEAIIAPRSSTFKKYGIIQTNSIGVVDNAYSGNHDEWMLPVLAMRDTFIPKNDRICQFRLLWIQPGIKVEIVDSLDSPDRGGFGSTGTT